MNEAIGPFALILLVFPGIALKIAIRALYGRRRLTTADPLQMLLSLSSTLLIVTAFLGGGMGLIGFSFTWQFFVFVLLPILVVCTIVLLMVVDRLRHAEHRALVWALAAAAERRVPLSEAARAFGDEMLGDTGVRALALAENLEQGQPLLAAARQARLRMSTAMRLAVRLGESLGVLGAAMRQQLDDSQSIDGELRAVVVRFFYLINVVLFFVFVVTFILWKIVPVFQRMFEEFGLKLPAPTVLLINASSWYVKHGWYQAAPLTLLLFLLTPTVLVLSVLYFLGWFPRNLPLIWRLFRRYDGALVMRGLALAVRRGMPLPQSMQLIAEQYPLSIVGRQLQEAAQQVSQGLDWREALRQKKLIGRAEAAVLAAAERVNNLAWALEQMADSALRRQIQRLHVLIQILFPMALLSVGLFVGFVAIALFMPLISLIQGLS